MGLKNICKLSGTYSHRLMVHNNFMEYPARFRRLECCAEAFKNWFSMIVHSNLEVKGNGFRTKTHFLSDRRFLWRIDFNSPLSNLNSMTATTNLHYFQPQRGPPFITDLCKHTLNEYAHEVHMRCICICYTKRNKNEQIHWMLIVFSPKLDTWKSISYIKDHD